MPCSNRSNRPSARLFLRWLAEHPHGLPSQSSISSWIGAFTQPTGEGGAGCGKVWGKALAAVFAMSQEELWGLFVERRCPDDLYGYGEKLGECFWL
jgi:hypothetical protein